MSRSFQSSFALVQIPAWTSENTEKDETDINRPSNALTLSIALIFRKPWQPASRNVCKYLRLTKLLTWTQNRYRTVNGPLLRRANLLRRPLRSKYGELCHMTNQPHTQKVSKAWRPKNRQTCRWQVLVGADHSCVAFSMVKVSGMFDGLKVLIKVKPKRSTGKPFQNVRILITLKTYSKTTKQKWTEHLKLCNLPWSSWDTTHCAAKLCTAGSWSKPMPSRWRQCLAAATSPLGGGPTFLHNLGSSILGFA